MNRYRKIVEWSSGVRPLFDNPLLCKDTGFPKFREQFWGEFNESFDRQGFY